MRGAWRKLERCRVSGSSDLIPVLDLGVQELTGVFPKTREEPVTAGPLQLVWCPDSGLLQLGHSFDPGELYGENYGYRSGLNPAMLAHLTGKIRDVEALVGLQGGDTVLDIGSNDGAALKGYRTAGVRRIGVDPLGEKFRRCYPDDVLLLSEFFSGDGYRRAGAAPARIVTSIAMVYDLEDPVAFARDVASVLAPDGIWHFEQAYLPAMLRTGAYDTICHEHLEYYCLETVRTILDAADLRVLDVQTNAVNGGSFAVTAVHRASQRLANDAVVDWLLGQEARLDMASLRPFREFEARVFRHREDLKGLLQALAADGKTVLGYGASTKGNVTLQFCGVTEAELPAIAERNPDKFGRYTPGSRIPIIPEAEARAMRPDYFLVLPWHFKEGVLQREAEHRARGGRFIFPFPEIEIV